MGYRKFCSESGIFVENTILMLEQNGWFMDSMKDWCL